MTREDIICMATEAGFSIKRFEPPIIATQHSNGSFVGVDDQLLSFAKKVAALEREACAKVCDKFADEALVVGDEYAVMCFEQAEDAIRARGQ